MLIAYASLKDSKVAIKIKTRRGLRIQICKDITHTDKQTNIQACVHLSIGITYIGLYVCMHMYVRVRRLLSE